jgi:pyruvate formate lyase activating enzyme
MLCPHCWNDRYAWAQASTDLSDEQRVDPDDIVVAAKNAGVQGIAGDYNEASIAVQWWRDIFTLAQQNGLYTALVTNGYSSPEALEVLLPLTDLYRVDFKAWSQEAFNRQVRSCRVEVPFQSVMQAKRYGCFVCCVTAIIPTLNDEPSEVKSIAAWIAQNLGTETPYILTGYAPAGVRKDIPALGDDNPRLNEFRQLAKDQGLANVF